jgi:hypothetical protein
MAQQKGSFSLDTVVSQTDVQNITNLANRPGAPGFEKPVASTRGDFATFKPPAAESAGDFGFGATTGTGDFGSTTPDGTFQNQQQLHAEQQAEAQPVQEGWGDAALKWAWSVTKGMGWLLADTLKSMTARTVDDFSGIFKRWAIAQLLVGVVVGGLLMLIGGGLGAQGLGWNGTGGNVFLWGVVASILCLACHLIIDTLRQNISKEIKPFIETVESLPLVADAVTDAYVANIDSSIENVVSDDLLAELDAHAAETAAPAPVAAVEAAPAPAPAPAPVVQRAREIPDFAALEKEMAGRKSTLTRKDLLRNFVPFFMKVTPTFKDTRDIVEGSDTFNQLRAIVIMALATAQNIGAESVQQKLLAAQEKYSSFVLIVERVPKLRNLKAVSTEIENFFRAGMTRENYPGLTQKEIEVARGDVTASTTILGHNWEITVNKGVRSIISMGDCFLCERTMGFFEDEKNVLPIVAGVDEYGEVMLEDAARLDAMMVVGISRSGKSWLINSLLTYMAVFNSPEEVSFIVIDPKITNLFNTFALLPHVIGLHEGKNILEILNEVLEVEAPRRAKQLRAAKVENIGDYNKANPQNKMPWTFIVIDEIVTIVGDLGKLREGEKAADAKARVARFQEAIKTIITKLPYVGIGIMFVPHRALAVIDKTVRGLIKFKAAVMASPGVVEETLEAKIGRPLTSAGDIALRTVTRPSACFVRGVAVADNDTRTTDLLQAVAKAFYQMGVNIPVWTHLTVSHNRDNEVIRKTLLGDVQQVRF